MAYQQLPTFEPRYGNRYGFRQKPAPATAAPGTDTPAAPEPLASASHTRLNDYSGTSAESQGPTIDNNDSDNNFGPGTRLDGSVPEVSAPASFASQHEAFAYNRAGFNNGYFGTVTDAAAASARGNAAATGTLQDFLGSGTTGRVSAPGTLGFIGTHIADTVAGGPRYDYTNIDIARDALSSTGDLYGPEASGYAGDSLEQQQNVSDIDAARTYGSYDEVPATPTSVTTAPTPEPTNSALTEQHRNYDYYQHNSNDSDSGQTDGTQTGGETSHAGGYGGFADDTAATNSDSGGGGGGGK